MTDNDQYPWAKHLFNIGPRDCLQLDMRIVWQVTRFFPERHTPDSAAYFMMILRNFLLRNARETGLGYEGIRVRCWNMGNNIWLARLECHDEWVREGNPRHVSRLEPPDYDNSEIQHVPTIEYMASNDPPREQEPTPPREGWRQRPGDRASAPGDAGDDDEEEDLQPSPSPPPSGRQRQRVQPPKSALDD